MTEFEIGLLLGLSGLVIFLLEMPLIEWLNKKEQVKYILCVYRIDSYKF